MDTRGVPRISRTRRGYPASVGCLFVLIYAYFHSFVLICTYLCLFAYICPYLCLFVFICTYLHMFAIICGYLCLLTLYINGYQWTLVDISGY